MEGKQRRVNVVEKERCVPKKKTPLTVVSNLFLDLVTCGRFGCPVASMLIHGCAGIERPIPLPSFITSSLRNVPYIFTAAASLFLGQVLWSFFFPSDIPLLDNTLYVQFSQSQSKISSSTPISSD